MRLGYGLAVGAISAASAWCGSAAAETISAHQLVEEANEAFSRDDFKAALEGYKQAEVLKPESPILAFNAAVAHYKLREFDQARELLKQALRTRDIQLEAKAKYNLGNVAYSQALGKLGAPGEAVELLREAIQHYRGALELDPDDTDARANAQAAQLLIKDLLDKLKKQQERGKSQPQSQPASQPTSQPTSQPQPSAQSQPTEPSPQPQEGQPEPRRQERNSQTPVGSEPQERKELTREEAQRLLQAVRDKERQRRAANVRRARVGRVRVLKDW